VEGCFRVGGSSLLPGRRWSVRMRRMNPRKRHASPLIGALGLGTCLFWERRRCRVNQSKMLPGFHQSNCKCADVTLWSRKCSISLDLGSDGRGHNGRLPGERKSGATNFGEPGYPYPSFPVRRRRWRCFDGRSKNNYDGRRTGQIYQGFGISPRGE
jgi:hypothetical protein